ncbi:hypothetical protein ZIOFF_064262 [Zingiber officinale]|uniref:RmlD-like substrate binding domain-containing protein n=1 Tax=Zingiber officinale TaxID=94328 RepID=A0A8J5EVV5_ZINOF|nr:hypothetical protein ZIOFF_064262 [Zingiber officinale]
MGLKTENGSAASGFKFLIYGRTGWIGGLLGRLCTERGIPFAYGAGRLENRVQLEDDIAENSPTHVFNAAGVTGRPNVDWCETHRAETIRANVVGTLTLADVCRQRGLILINYATGCIFEYDDKHPLGSGVGFVEEDTPNFVGSFYSKTKAMIGITKRGHFDVNAYVTRDKFAKILCIQKMALFLPSMSNASQLLNFALVSAEDEYEPNLFLLLVEELLKNYENVCTLRVRMPISSDLANPRNFITKITRYDKVVNIPNSMTILDELLPISIEMAKRNLTGIWNFTNPGVVSHNEILEMYRDYIDPKFTWKNFTLEEQAKVIVAPRSNNELDTTKLNNEFPELLPIKESLIKYVFQPNKKKSAS